MGTTFFTPNFQTSPVLQGPKTAYTKPKTREGQAMGNFLIDLSIGSFIHHLYSASNFFKEMVVLKSNEKCIMELSRWLHDRTGAYDWKHASTVVAELEDKRDQHQNIEMRLKSSIRQVLKCNFEQENITSPVELPLADCVVSGLLLDNICKNEDEYMKNLEKIIQLLKPGGQLLLFSSIDKSYMIVSGERFHSFKYSENFVKNAFDKLGLIIDYCAVQRRRSMNECNDYKAIMFTAAHKGE
ncbi:nicotinamide N-methyltransferase-like [Rana temporaria]|uniref:nicotinamide N-methyltransferase-like n=1 Tax=Rana temporaria TaxID=8407 RepID=UPI001AADFB5C|nr:nicotinamide N-methyltransferase-like [Rana temporaria]